MYGDTIRFAPCLARKRQAQFRRRGEGDGFYASTKILQLTHLAAYSQDEKADVCDVGKCVSGTRKHLQNAKLSSRSVNAESVKDTSCTGTTACTLLQRWIERAPVQVRCPKSICKCENSPGGTWCFSYLRMIVHSAQKYLPNRQSCWTSHNRSLPAQPVPLSGEPLCRRAA